MIRRFIEENKGVITVILAMLTLATPFYWNRSEKDAQTMYNTKRLDFYDEYARESTKSREEVVKAMGQLTTDMKNQKEDVKEIKDGIKSLVEYNKEQQKMIQKFYHLNPSIRNPRYNTELVNAN